MYYILQYYIRVRTTFRRSHFAPIMRFPPQTLYQVGFAAAIAFVNRIKKKINKIIIYKYINICIGRKYFVQYNACKIPLLERTMPTTIYTYKRLFVKTTAKRLPINVKKKPLRRFTDDLGLSVSM